MCKAAPTPSPTSLENQDLGRTSTVTAEENGEWKEHVKYSLQISYPQLETRSKS